MLAGSAVVNQKLQLAAGFLLLVHFDSSLSDLSSFLHIKEALQWDRGGVPCALVWQFFFRRTSGQLSYTISSIARSYRHTITTRNISIPFSYPKSSHLQSNRTTIGTVYLSLTSRGRDGTHTSSQFRAIRVRLSFIINHNNHSRSPTYSCPIKPSPLRQYTAASIWHKCQNPLPSILSALCLDFRHTS